MARIEQQRVTVKDVAKLAGVSTATVTRTFANGDTVLPETRQRVMAAVATLGYRPDPIARDLRKGNGRTGAVGLAISSFTNAFQTSVAAGAERELRREGMQLLIGSTDSNPTREPELALAMVDRRVRVLMMMPDSNDRDFLEPTSLFGTPVVLVGRPANGAHADVVITEDDRSVEEATTELLVRGHRRIAALAGVDNFRARQRLEGFYRALEKRGTTAVPEMIVTGVATSAESAATMERLMTLDDPPTAVVALNLGISDGVLLDRIINKRTIAFVALDESELSIRLGVSAVVRDPEELGRQAAALAIARIENADAPTQTIVLPSRLIKRGTGEIGPER